MDVAAEHSGSSLTLYIAILGIAGTLAATFVTQWLNGKRDEKQWQRQKQLQDERHERDLVQEEARWSRERVERADQWEREDAARLHQDRLKTYVELMAAVQRVSALCYQASLLTESRPPEPDNFLRFLEGWAQAVDCFKKTFVAVELIASPEVFAKLTLVHYHALVSDTGRIVAERDLSAVKLIGSDSQLIGSLISSLRDQLRQELGSRPLRSGD
jgi:hypothetical protein